MATEVDIGDILNFTLSPHRVSLILLIHYYRAFRTATVWKKSQHAFDQRMHDNATEELVSIILDFTSAPSYQYPVEPSSKQFLYVLYMRLAEPYRSLVINLWCKGLGYITTASVLLDTLLQLNGSLKAETSDGQAVVTEDNYQFFFDERSPLGLVIRAHEQLTSSLDLNDINSLLQSVIEYNEYLMSVVPISPPLRVLSTIDLRSFLELQLVLVKKHGTSGYLRTLHQTPDSMSQNQEGLSEWVKLVQYPPITASNCKDKSMLAQWTHIEAAQSRDFAQLQSAAFAPKTGSGSVISAALIQLFSGYRDLADSLFTELQNSFTDDKAAERQLQILHRQIVASRNLESNTDLNNAGYIKSIHLSNEKDYFDTSALQELEQTLEGQQRLQKLLKQRELLQRDDLKAEIDHSLASMPLPRALRSDLDGAVLLDAFSHDGNPAFRDMAIQHSLRLLFPIQLEQSNPLPLELWAKPLAESAAQYHKGKQAMHLEQNLHDLTTARFPPYDMSQFCTSTVLASVIQKHVERGQYVQAVLVKALLLNQMEQDTQHGFIFHSDFRAKIDALLSLEQNVGRIGTFLDKTLNGQVHQTEEQNTDWGFVQMVCDGKTPSSASTRPLSTLASRTSTLITLLQSQPGYVSGGLLSRNAANLTSQLAQTDEEDAVGTLLQQTSVFSTDEDEPSSHKLNYATLASTQMYVDHLLAGTGHFQGYCAAHLYCSDFALVDHPLPCPDNLHTLLTAQESAQSIDRMWLCNRLALITLLHDEDLEKVLQTTHYSIQYTDLTPAMIREHMLTILLRLDALRLLLLRSATLDISGKPCCSRFHSAISQIHKHIHDAEILLPHISHPSMQQHVAEYLQLTNTRLNNL